MVRLFTTVDKLLRGGFTAREDLRLGRVGVPVRLLLVAGLVLGIIYGIFMGLYGLLRPESPSFLQLLATTTKVPLLFLLTLVVTYPSLYVFSALASSSLRFVETLRLLLAGIVVNLALLASFGPVTGFFTLSTESYQFMIVLNVFFFAVAGVAGLIFVRKALSSVFERPDGFTPEPEAESAKSAGFGSGSGPQGERGQQGKRDKEEPLEGKSRKDTRSGQPRPASATTPPPLGPWEELAPESRRATKIFFIWAAIYGVVGAQMGWILRPFIGSPDLPFQLFRERESNFFEALLRTIGELFR